MNKPDWDTIRKEYEGGLSLRLLAEKHGVPKSTISRHAKVGQWDGTAKSGTVGQEPHNLHILRTEIPSTPSAVDGANLGITALVEYLRDNAKGMDLMEHVKAASALYQYNRIIVNAVPEAEEDNAELITIDTRDLSAERLIKLKTFALEMKESEG